MFAVHIKKRAKLKPDCLGKQHFCTIKLSEPDFSTKVLRLSVSSFRLENSLSQPSKQNIEPLSWIRNCLRLGVDPFCDTKVNLNKQRQKMFNTSSLGEAWVWFTSFLFRTARMIRWYSRALQRTRKTPSSAASLFSFCSTKSSLETNQICDVTTPCVSL